MSDMQVPIARRTLAAGSTVVVAKIMRPQEDEGDYRCRYVLEAGQDKKLGYAIGIDGVQALQLAMAKINADLLAMSEALGAPITWLDSAPGDSGFVA